MDPNRLNKIIHERVRLAVMSSLSARKVMTFVEMKELLKVTDGNLSIHTAILEKNGLISIEKSFEGKKPKTSFSLTEKGRIEFQEYLSELENMLKSGRSPV